MAGQGWGPARTTEAVTRVEAMQEREKQEKERAGSGTIPAYICRADTSVDEHKQAGLRGSQIRT
jgi:hypothetical protein